MFFVPTHTRVYLGFSAFLNDLKNSDYETIRLLTAELYKVTFCNKFQRIFTRFQRVS